MNRQTRRINDYVSGVDLVKCSRQLLDNLRAAQEKTGVPYNEIAETTEIPLERLEGLLHSDQPHLYREEVIRVALVTGTALDELFGLPQKMGLPVLDRVLDRYQRRSEQHQ